MNAQHCRSGSKVSPDRRGSDATSITKLDANFRPSASIPRMRGRRIPPSSAGAAGSRKVANFERSLTHQNVSIAQTAEESMNFGTAILRSRAPTKVGPNARQMTEEKTGAHGRFFISALSLALADPLVLAITTPVEAAPNIVVRIVEQGSTTAPQPTKSTGGLQLEATTRP